MKKILAARSENKSKLNILFGQVLSTLDLDITYGKVTLIVRNGRVPRIDVESSMDEIASSMNDTKIGGIFQKFSIDMTAKTDIK